MAIAAIVTVFAMFALTPAASAVEYGETVTPGGNGTTVTVTVPDDDYTAGFTELYATADDTLVGDIQQVSLKTWGPFAVSADSPHTASLKYTFKKCVASTNISFTLKNPTTGETKNLGSTTVKAPATGNCSAATTSSTSTSSNKLAKTGTVMLPYLTAVAVLAVAGAAVFAVRRSATR